MHGGAAEPDAEARATPCHHRDEGVHHVHCAEVVLRAVVARGLVVPQAGRVLGAVREDVFPRRLGVDAARRDRGRAA